MLRHFTIKNNCVFPIDRMKETFLLVSWRWKEDIKTKILTSHPWFEPEDKELLLSQDEILYQGLWSRCNVTYPPQDFPVGM